MNKKLILLIITISLTLGMLSTPTSAATYNDVSADAYYADSVEALTTYGIISGYNGSYRPDSTVTRAEFAKVTALISGLEDDSFSNAGYKIFDDVDIEHWATGYINTVSDNKIIIGYPNGTFQPERQVTYAEALTVILRTLGYSTAELGDNWPYAYMIKAKGLGLSDNLNFSDNAPISRADLAVIINRALQTDINKTSTKLISKLEISVLEDTFIIATQKEDKTLAVDEIRTTSGVYKLKNDDFSFTTPSQGDLVVDKDGKVINFIETEKFTREYTTVDSVVNGEIYFSNETSSTGLGLSNNTGVYNDGTITTYGAFKTNIKEGAGVSVVFDKYGSVKFLLFGNAEYTEAVVVYSDVYNALKTVGVTKELIDKANVIKEGYAATIADIETYDVVYYLAENSTIYVYSDKISGVYNEAFPNKANVTSVEISGNVLELETQSAVYKLGEKSGSYKIGSRVTALLGKDGKIADIISLDKSDKSNYGVILSSSIEESTDIKDKGKQYHYITFLNGEGNTVKYKTSTNYDDYVGYIGKITFDKNEYAIFNTLSGTNVITGVVDKVNKKIGNYWLTTDCVIIEKIPKTTMSTQISNSAYVIEMDDIIPTELTDKHVIHAVTTGEFDDISLIFVENVSSQQVKYGILKDGTGNARGASVTGRYEVFSDKQLSTYTTNFYNSITDGSAVAMVFNGNSLLSVKEIVTIGTRKKVLASDIGRIKIDSGVYKICDDVQVIKKTSSGYVSLSKTDINNLKGKNVSLFADTNPKDGGLIRIILVLD